MLSKHARIFVILQLCLAFSLVLWVLSGPFTHDYFTTQSETLLFRAVMGDEKAHLSSRNYRNAQRYAQVDPVTKAAFAKAYRTLQTHSQRGFFTKFGEALLDLTVHLPLFTRVWIVLSILLGVLLLLDVEGASSAIWLLPLVSIAFAVDNYQNGTLVKNHLDETFLPSEEYLIVRYLDEPLAHVFTTQHEQLLKAWHLYLVTEWTEEPPSKDPALLVQQLQRGEHAFHVAWLKERLDASRGSQSQHIVPRKTWPLLALYILWNALFAATVSSSCRLKT